MTVEDAMLNTTFPAFRFRWQGDGQQRYLFCSQGERGLAGRVPTFHYIFDDEGTVVGQAQTTLPEVLAAARRLMTVLAARERDTQQEQQE